MMVLTMVRVNDTTRVWIRVRVRVRVRAILGALWWLMNLTVTVRVRFSVYYL